MKHINYNILFPAIAVAVGLAFHWYSSGQDVINTRDSRSYIVELNKVPSQPALKAGPFSGASAILINGVPVFFQGEANPLKMHYRYQVLIPLPQGILRAGKNTVAVELFGDSANPVVFPAVAPQTGELLTLMENRVWRRSLENGLFILFFSVALYHLILFQRLRNLVYNLYFSLFLFFFSAYWFASGVMREFPGVSTQLILLKAEFSILFVMTALLYLFLSEFFQRKSKVAGLLLKDASLSLSLFGLFLNYSQSIILLRIWQGLLPVAFLYLLTMSYFAMKQRQEGGRVIFAGLIFLLFATIYDILSTVTALPQIKMAPLAFLVFLLAIAILLTSYFTSLYKKIESTNNNLESLVEKRTEALKENLQIIQALKEKQDGDYFLTSLLILPLTGSSLVRGKIRIESISFQKTTFQFKNRNLEIGGDLNAVYEINLRKRHYIVFANADAMGKSLQGAAGALVFGSVLRAVVDRTMKNASAHNQHPERWLKNAFLDLQNAFSAFDGSMLISFVIGLADTQAGLLYYINAEHPHAIVLQNNSARSSYSENALYKAGNPMQPAFFGVQIYQLSPGGALLFGSDGKDEVLLHGQKEILTGEDFFLDIVKQNPGASLPEYYDMVAEKAKILDDFSMLKVAHTESSQMPEEKEAVSSLLQLAKAHRRAGFPGRALALLEEQDHGNNPVLLKEKIYAHLGQLNYPMAANLMEEYLALRPGDSGILFRYSIIQKKLGNLHSAADFAERLFLREPSNEKNAAQLLETYISLNRFDRVSQLLEAARFFGMQDPRISQAEQLFKVNKKWEEAA